MKWIKRGIFIFHFLGLSLHSYNESVYFNCFWGHYNRLSKRSDVAHEYFNKLIKTGWYRPGYEGLVLNLSDTHNFYPILNLESEIATHLSDNPEIQLTFVKACEACNQTAKAEKLLMNLEQYTTSHQEIAYGAAMAYIRHNQPEKSLSLIRQYLQAHEEEKPHDFIFYFLESQIYMNLKQPEKAKESITRALELNPQFDQGWLLSGLIHELAGQIDQAIKGYQTFLDLVGKDEQVEQQIIRLMMQKKAPAIPNITVQELVERAMMHYHNRQFTAALNIINKCLAADPSCKAAILLKLDILSQTGKYAEAIELLENLIAYQPANPEWYRALHILYHASPYKEQIIHMLKKNESLYDQQILPLLYYADIMLLEKQYAQAVASLKKALYKVQSNELKAKILYQIARAYYDSGNVTPLAQIAQQALSFNHSYTPLFNILAYYYATKGKDLPAAQKFINKALYFEHNNIHYLDTQALIWYKNGSLKKSVTLLKKLYTSYPHDFYIRKHLSKALYKLGSKQDALHLLKGAESLTTDSYQKERTLKLFKRWNPTK